MDFKTLLKTKLNVSPRTAKLIRWIAGAIMGFMVGLATGAFFVGHILPY